MLEICSIFLVAVIGLGFAGYLATQILKEEEGTPQMREIARSIQEGAKAFLYREYKILLVFIIILTPILWLALDESSTSGVNEGKYTAIAFILGALCSGAAGYAGMRIAVQANVRTANAAISSLHKALRIAFSSGAVMGLSVVSLALLGLSVLYLMLVVILGMEHHTAIHIIKGFGLGSSSIALFARVGGGIFTKAADVAADLVGKIEIGIPEDDPRNPAVIADNVGDNVGDVAGMGGDLFESYVGTLIASLTIGVFTFHSFPSVIFPLLVAAIGIIASIFGTFFVTSGHREEQPLIHGAFRNGLFFASALVVVGVWFLSKYALPHTFDLLGKTYTNHGVFAAILIGLLGGIAVGLITEYFTSSSYGPVKQIAQGATTGAGTNIITGLSVGYQSTVIPILIICAVIFFSHANAGLYGIALSGVGMLSTLGISLAVDAYGPVADNAGGIAEMAKLDKEVRMRTDALDEAGNTTAAIGKGFAISSAMLSALALFSAFTIAADIKDVSLTNPTVLIGLFLGAMLPYLFSSLTMKAVGKTAFKLIEEVRRQFKTIDGLMEGKAKPEYGKCVDIATTAALKEMIVPGIIAIAAPLLVGLLLGTEALSGLLVGGLISGFLMAIMMANAGGAWDNAKKYIESGKFGGKGSDSHKAAIVGDTVGDPFKDTSGPSLNILINVMNIVSLVFVPVFVKYGGLLLK
ncbi:MAG: putative K(+)-stimulated pyrophosphate-energized sodium pump [Chlamydiae bacterium]|nr:putative K(+)-stimulated pyrophosphate-energized sodium pump [Chlamydiota bacterium]